MEEARKRPQVAKVLVTIILLVTGFSAFGQRPMWGGQGRVLNTTTKIGIAGADVTMACRNASSGQPVVVRTLTVSSGADGGYKFSPADVAGCDHGIFSVSKTGFQSSGVINVGYANSTFEEIPQVLYLTPNADIVMFRLVAITPARLGTHFRPDGSPVYAPEYDQWYKAFLEAKNIAKSEREVTFVRERYCDALPKLYSSLTESEKSARSQSLVDYSDWHGNYFKGKHDYDAQVKGFCAR